MTVARTILTVIALVALAALITAPELASAQGAPSSPMANASLSADEVVRLLFVYR